MKTIARAYFGHWSIWLYIALAFGFLFAAENVRAGEIQSSWWILLLSIPMAPFFEWAAHKYTLHKVVDPQKNPLVYKYMVRMHYQHHWDPNNLKHVFAPVSSVVFMSLFLGAIAGVVFRDLAHVLMFLSGSIFYFLYYEWCHTAHHVPQYRPVTAYGRYIKMAHTWHHYKNENYYWGVTNPIGDWVFGTFPKPEDVEKSPNARGLGRSSST